MGPLDGDSGEAFRRGMTAGGIAERLDSHDRHFASINGSLISLVTELQGMRLALQRLSDQAEANAATVVVTARALAAAEQVRRDTAQDAERVRARTWSPVAKALAIVGGLAAAAAVVGWIVTLTT